MDRKGVLKTEKKTGQNGRTGHKRTALKCMDNGGGRGAGQEERKRLSNIIRNEKNRERKGQTRRERN